VVLTDNPDGMTKEIKINFTDYAGERQKSLQIKEK